MCSLIFGVIGKHQTVPASFIDHLRPFNPSKIGFSVNLFVFLIILMTDIGNMYLANSMTLIVYEEEEKNRQSLLAIDIKFPFMRLFLCRNRFQHGFDSSIRYAIDRYLYQVLGDGPICSCRSNQKKIDGPCQPKPQSQRGPSHFLLENIPLGFRPFLVVPMLPDILNMENVFFIHSQKSELSEGKKSYFLK